MFALCALLGGAAAQEKLEVSQPEPGTLRLGDTARVSIEIAGKSARPRTPELPSVDGLRMRLLGPSRNSYTFYDGQQLIERVGVQYSLELQPTRAGVFEVPSFPIWTGSKEQRTPILRLEAKQDLVGAELGFLSVEISPRRVYVHEPVRVHLDYGVQQGVKLADDVANRYRYQDIEVQAAWLDEFPGGERLELPEPSGETRLAVCNRKLIRTAFDGEHAREDRQWQRYSFDRAFLPTRLGKVTLPAPMLRFRVLRGRTRTDRFGRPAGQATENYYVYGEPAELEVLPIPEKGRPTPYFGAVGRFTIDAALDRDTVRVGESVKLTVTVRGRGNFEFLRLPELAALDGFHKLGANEAQRDADQVVITYDLTPLSADVDAVPAIEWNYFDTTPGVERFVEVATAPLALAVQPLAAGEGLAPLPEAAAAAVTVGVDDIFDLPALDGVGPRRSAPPTWLAALLLLSPWALVFAGLQWRRARQRAIADVAGMRARRARASFEQALERGDEVLDAFAAYLGDRLDVAAAAVISPELAPRLSARGLDADLASEVALAVERGTHARYGGGAALTATEARALVAKLEGVSFSVGAAARGALLFVAVLIGAGGLRAQGAAGVEAYRAGDYVAADAAFEDAYASTGDRRLLRARGNCQFRLGDLPRARWLYERALLGAPRDAELLANLRVVRQRLELPRHGGDFGGELRWLLDRMTGWERVALGGLAMALAAACLLCGWRRVGLRWVGALSLVTGLTLAVDALCITPTRPAMAVALEELSVTAEPRGGMEAIATVRPGVMVTLGGGASGAFVRVEVGGRVGYAPRRAVGVVE
ncbi:MAG: BatD family protein [Planctomycetota bacterium]|nr:BatD family protein [Planctomycetota bacterium]